MRIPPQIEYMLRKLADSGYGAYLVGGCVRDFLLGGEPSDYDITTSALPLETASVFDCDRVIPTGLKHGTVTVLYDGMSSEITTYRTETTYTDGRHPDSVEFSREISDDLSRRDFTVNAMAMDISGEIVDLYGGKRDLDSRIIRAVGNPIERFTEDALRILRAFRFASKLGFDIEKETLDAAILLSPRLSLVSRERIFVELEKLITGVCVGKVLEIMHSGKVFDSIFDSPVINTEVFSYIDSLPRRADIRLAALLISDENADKHVASLKTSSQFADNVKAIVRAPLPKFADNPALRRYIYETGKQAALDRVLVSKDHAMYEKINSLVTLEDCFGICDLAVSGRDIVSATKLSGKAIGDALQTLLFAVFDEKTKNNKNDLIEYLKKVDKEQKI